MCNTMLCSILKIQTGIQLKQKSKSEGLVCIYFILNGFYTFLGFMCCMYFIFWVVQKRP